MHEVQWVERSAFPALSPCPALSHVLQLQRCVALILPADDGVCLDLCTTLDVAREMFQQMLPHTHEKGAIF
jgi:hypothetical protein